jgi:membrane-associated protease RseP (regulator of RpoE activity)
MTDDMSTWRDQAPRERRRLVDLALIVAVAVALALATGTFSTLAVVAAIVAMILLHELGHFLVAKAAGMKVSEYFVGYGPRLWSIRRGETEYGVKALPLGGYVRIVGMNNLEQVDPADEPRTYRQQSFPRRLAVVVAGSTVHFVLAFALLFALWTVIGVPDYDHPTLRIASISRLASGPSPAQAAGLKIGDRVVAFDGTPARKWDDLVPYIRAHPEQTIRLTIERGGRTFDVAVTPTNSNPQGEHVGFIGVGPQYPNVRTGPIAGATRSARAFGSDVVLTVKGIGSFFSPGRLSNYGDQLMGNAHGAKSSDDVRFLSPVALVRVSGQAAESGLSAVIVFLIGLNIGVGVFNMIPLLPLDGGHVAIAVYERIRSRRGRRYHADVTKLLPVTMAVVGVLIVIVVSSLWLDITRPMANPFR